MLAGDAFLKSSFFFFYYTKWQYLYVCPVLDRVVRSVVCLFAYSQTVYPLINTERFTETRGSCKKQNSFIEHSHINLNKTIKNIKTKPKISQTHIEIWNVGTRRRSVRDHSRSPFLYKCFWSLSLKRTSKVLSKSSTLLAELAGRTC